MPDPASAMGKTDAASYKARKEAFVSNLSGSSITEINLVTLVAASSILLWTALQKRQSLFTPYGPVSFTADFLLNVCAVLFALTAYASAPLFLNILLIAPSILLLLPLQNPAPNSNGSAKEAKRQKVPSKMMKHLSPPSGLVVRPFLTHYRGAMLIVTTIAILAVDFPIFPRRFAKVETWGTSLMDLGVGSFVFSAGVVSARAVAKAAEVHGKGPRPSMSSRMLTAIRHSAPLLVLGFVRLYSVKGLDYAEHVTEYGVHWNFFFTLALLPPFVELSDSMIRHLLRSYDVLALILAVVYEIVLNNTGLLRYILVSPRGPDLLSKNREGIFSFFGYLSIFLAGRGTGTIVVALKSPLEKLTPKVDGIPEARRERSVVLAHLAFQAVLYIVLYALSTSYYILNLNVSRRLANLPYVLWVASFNNAQILLFGLIEHWGPQFTYNKADDNLRKGASSKIMQAFNRNGLVIFLVANLLTGFVNLSLNTLDMSNIKAMCVMIAYAGAVTVLAIILDHFDIQIKV